jgi:hypothetical protein
LISEPVQVKAARNWPTALNASFAPVAFRRSSELGGGSSAREGAHAPGTHITTTSVNPKDIVFV